MWRSWTHFHEDWSLSKTFQAQWTFRAPSLLLRKTIHRYLLQVSRRIGFMLCFMTPFVELYDTSLVQAFSRAYVYNILYRRQGAEISAKSEHDQRPCCPLLTYRANVRMTFTKHTQETLARFKKGQKRHTEYDTEGNTEHWKNLTHYEKQRLWTWTKNGLHSSAGTTSSCELIQEE